MRMKSYLREEEGNMDATKYSLPEYLGEIVQVGIVVEDVQNAVDSMRAIFGVEPDVFQVNNYTDAWHLGDIADAPMHVACYNMFGTQLEFIQPLGGNDTWRDYLNEGPHHGHGLHHLRFDVEDNDVASQLLHEAGIEKCMEGRSIFNPATRFTYYDARDTLGFIIECVTKVD